MTKSGTLFRVVNALLYGILLSVIGNPAAAENTESIEQLRKEIAQLEVDIQANQQKQSDSIAQMRRHDLRIAKLVRLLHDLDQHLTNNQTRIRQLQVEQQDLYRDSQQHRRQLAQLLNQIYRLGNQDMLRIFLSVEDAASVQRQLSYYAYFSRARFELLEKAGKTEKILKTNEQTLKQTQSELSVLQSDRQRELNNLRQAKAVRGAFLSQINTTLSHQKSQLQEIRDNLSNLQNLIFELDEPRQLPEPKQVFATLKGELPWPVSGGSIIEKFGNTVSGVKRQGVVIAAGEEQSVYPVAGGKVLYADWLRGFGMLLIIDHGGQYMSLYGQNNALFCDKGDWVNPNQVIASVGNSGSGDKNGLYFELRYKGKPINPNPWFKR